MPPTPIRDGNPHARDVDVVDTCTDATAVSTSPAADSVQIDPQSTSLLNLLCAWSIGFLGAVEATVTVPSLWKYIKELGGSEHYYGICVTAFPVGRVSCMGFFGLWADRRPYKEVFVVSLLLSMLSGLLYSAAPAVGIWSIVAGRALLGMMSAQTVATQAFVARNTSQQDRTRYMSINVLVSNTLQLAGPAFNLLIVGLPHFNVSIGSKKWVFNNFTWVGYFLFCGQLLVLTFIVLCFREPSRPSFSPPPPLGGIGNLVTLGGFFPWGRVLVDRWLHQTGAWFIFVNNFRNTFTINAVNYVIPLITDRDYGWGQLKNSYIFLGLAIESIVSTTALGYASKYLNDRALIGIWSAISHSGLLLYVMFSTFGMRAVPAPFFLACLIWYDFGSSMPPTQSLYSKLIGKGNVGLYFSVLQSNGSLSNVVAGQLVGAAYGALGAPFLWVSTHALWVFSWIALCGMWKRLDPIEINKMHNNLLSGRSPSTTSLQQIPGNL